MTAIRYAAIFAEDLSLSDEVRETLGYTDGIAGLSELVGTVLHTQAEISLSNAQDFWPIAGAEAAAEFLNNQAVKENYNLISETVFQALHAAFVAG